MAFILILGVLMLLGMPSLVASAHPSTSDYKYKGIWKATGSMTTARYLHTATLLPNGKVLVAGGQGNYQLYSSAELYDPTSGTWTATGSMTTERTNQTATLLTNGLVLVAGGLGYQNIPLASAELYNPRTGAWTATSSMSTARVYHTATLLTNGLVLVSGGEPPGVGLASAELYT